MAQVFIKDGNLIVQMGNLERFQTATARFETPLQHVVGVDTGRGQTIFAGSFVSGAGFGVGTGFKMPLLPFGGRISTRSGKMLIAFRNADKCVTISLKDEPYDKVVVQVDAKDQVAVEIRNAISPAQS